MNTRKPGHTQRGALHATSAAMIVVIALVAAIGTIQLALVSNAKTTLDYAALMAARAGAVSHADSLEMAVGLLNGLAPMYGSRSAPAGGSSEAEGVDWALPDPSAVAGFDSGLMSGTTLLETYEEGIELTSKGDATRAGAALTALADLNSAGTLYGIAITNPVQEAFDDFGESLDGYTQIPNKGIWRRTGNPEGAASSMVEICEPVTIPYYEDPSTPPSFSEPSVSTVRDIVGAFTWNADILKEEQDTDCESAGLIDDCDGISISGDSIAEKYINEVSGPRGQAFASELDGIIDRYYNAEIDASEMYRLIRVAAEDFKADFAAADVESIEYCTKRGGLLGTCLPRNRETYTPDSPDWGPMERVDELIATVTVLEAGTGRVPSRDTLNMEAFEQAIGDARERNQRNGSPVSEWDSFVANELDPLWQTWVEDPPTPMYKEFISRASVAADNQETGADWTTTQQNYLTYLQAMGNNIDRPEKAYEKSQECRTEEVAGYVDPTIGARSDLNIQDANLLRIFVIYGHEPFFELPDAFYSAMDWSNDMVPRSRDTVPGPLRGIYDNIVEAGRIPLMSTSVVRMQSEARLNDSMLSASDPFFMWDNVGVE
ncbi:hypothetical protein [Marinobacter confluentis]|uniref:Uncharacterized protein n=1 Tax=Marinobacter confluentis TaxID=1697557 RepID=A0A4Z1C873_9GAMM|nr:hypothetical protein [Marinobacter confluentis]TGN41870.1 hypothetical protein E5Q11_04950 [Marinobacter confluentis]